MKRAKLVLAVVSMAVSAAVTAALWPNARDALAVLAAQDDPAALADVRLNSALRNSPLLIHDNISAALDAGDADLAGSFAELARDKDIALDGDLSKRVNDAVMEDNSTTQFAKRFAIGLVTGNADDVASLSGTIAGDLFVFGDIRDVVREGKHLAMGEETDHLILGLATRYVVLVMIIFVLVATFSSHRYWEFTDVAVRRAQDSSFYKNIAMLGGFLFLFVVGPGRFSLDAWLKRQR